MNARLSFLLVIAAMLPAGIAAADDRPVVVELFASQNCPACPQAHRTMQAVSAEQDDVLILTWSVDYWDYLGEPDPMAMPESKARQAAYAEQLALRAPYTPQSIYNGVKECPGPRRKDVEHNIRTLKRTMEPTGLVLSPTDTGFSVRGDTDRTVTLSLVHYLADGQHDTGMVNPVIGQDFIADWQGGEARFEVACQPGCAVLAQDESTAEILDALVLNKGSSE